MFETNLLRTQGLATLPFLPSPSDTNPAAEAFKAIYAANQLVNLRRMFSSGVEGWGKHRGIFASDEPESSAEFIRHKNGIVVMLVAGLPM